MGDGTKENPYTREDVLRIIQARGGSTEGLVLSDKWFEKGIDLRGISGGNIEGMLLKGIDLRKSHLEEADLTLADLEGAILWEANLEKANLGFANLRGANLRVANLKRCYFVNATLEGADLREAHLERANLFEANLEGANLWQAHLESSILVQTNLREANLTLASLTGACLVWAQFSDNTEFAGTDWGDYILGEERNGDFTLAKEAYWRLRHCHTNSGLHDIAAKFYYREKEAQKKQLSREFAKRFGSAKILNLLWSERTLTWSFLWLWVYWLLCGYGEKTFRVVISAATVIFGSTIIYWTTGAFGSKFWDNLYYSSVSFISLGYGGWVVPEPTGWVKGLGVSEAFIGSFLMALFLVTFTRKMTR